MKITRHKLRELIRETKIVQEGAIKNLIIEIGESIDAMLDETGNNQMVFKQVLPLIYAQYADQFQKYDDFEEFVINNIEYMFGLELLIRQA